MTHPPPATPSDDMPVDPLTARIVLRLDAAVLAFRAGEATGVPALDAASRLMGELHDDTIMRAAARREERPRVPQNPDRVELAILTALADTYGAEIMTNVSLAWSSCPTK
jgi:hypothetical protein